MTRVDLKWPIAAGTVCPVCQVDEQIGKRILVQCTMKPTCQTAESAEAAAQLTAQLKTFYFMLQTGNQIQTPHSQETEIPLINLTES